MKQLLFLSLFFSITSFSQSLDLGSPENIQGNLVDEKKKQLYVFYPDSIAVFDLVRFEKISNLETKIPFETFYNDYPPVSVDSEIYFIESLGGKVYKLIGEKLVRIDNSYTHKMQIRSTVFSHNDTIYRYGGYGFWSLRNFFTYFKDSYREWEMVLPLGSEVFPQGSMLTTVKIIDDDFYVYGGLILNESNPTESKANDQIWRFERKNNSWDFIGRADFQLNSYGIDISYGKEHIFMNLDEDRLYLVDVADNHLKTFAKKPIHRRIIPRYRSFYLDGKFYLLVWKSSTEKEVQLIATSEEDFFGELLASDPFYYNNEKILYFFSSLVLVLVAVLVFFQIKKIKIRRKKIIAEKDKVVFKRKSLDLDEKSIEVINLLLRSDEEVQYKDILEITENKNLNYAHNTKVMNAMLEEINFKLKSILNIDEDIITYKKSDLDKRIKVYSIEDSYFLVK